MKRHAGTLSSYYKAKETNLKRLHIGWFRLHDILQNKNYADSKKIVQHPFVDYQGGREGDAEHRGLSGLYDATLVDMCHDTFAQTYRMYSTNSEP